MRVCHNGPHDKLMRFLFMRSSALCTVAYGTIKIYHMNDAIIKDKYAGSGEAPALEGYLVSGKNCYLSNCTASTEEHCHVLATITSCKGVILSQGESFIPRTK